MNGNGKLYGIGVGPGDPELLTLKAVRLLRECDVVAAPDGERTAYQIARRFAEGKPTLFCSLPMTRDKAAMAESHKAAADAVCATLDEGKTVAFLTLGDPSIYSTYWYIHRLIAARGYAAELVPGVPSFCAVAAALGDGLCEGSDRLLIVPASHRDVGDCLTVDANYVFMKAGREIGKLRDTLAEHGLLDRSAMVENCGMAAERVYPRFADAPGESGYFSVVVVKRDGE